MPIQSAFILFGVVCIAVCVGLLIFNWSRAARTQATASGNALAENLPIVGGVNQQGVVRAIGAAEEGPIRAAFARHVPEIAEGVIKIRAIAREPGYRSKVAVSSSDEQVDCVGACVGDALQFIGVKDVISDGTNARYYRIKNISDELAGERCDVLRWSEDPQVLIANALQPAEIASVRLCPMLSRAIALMREDQLPWAIGHHGHNVMLASKLCGWDIELMTPSELDDCIECALGGFAALQVDDSLAKKLVGEGYLTFDDLGSIEPTSLMKMGKLTFKQALVTIKQAQAKAEEARQAAAIERGTATE